MIHIFFAIFEFRASTGEYTDYCTVKVIKFVIEETNGETLHKLQLHVSGSGRRQTGAQSQRRVHLEFLVNQSEINRNQ